MASRHAMRVIRPRAWNRTLGELSRKLEVRYRETESGTRFRHPWNTVARYDLENGVWSVNVQPGYINAAETLGPSIPIRAAPEETLTRLGIQQRNSSRPVVPWLSERPWFPTTAWRALGTDADPAAEPETVPRFFLESGVESASQLQLDLADPGVSVTQRVTVPLDQRRLLRAVDVVLRVAKPMIEASFEETSSGPELTFQVSSSPAPPELSLRRKFVEPPEAPSLVEQLLTGATDLPYTERRVATVYLLSPPRLAAGSEVGPSWQPFVEHSLFFNRGFGYEVDLSVVPTVDQSFTIPLAGGVAGQTIENLIEDLNDNDAELSLLLSQGSVKTDFWTL